MLFAKRGPCALTSLEVSSLTRKTSHGFQIQSQTQHKEESFMWSLIHQLLSHTNELSIQEMPQSTLKAHSQNTKILFEIQEANLGRLIPLYLLFRTLIRFLPRTYLLTRKMKAWKPKKKRMGNFFEIRKSLLHYDVFTPSMRQKIRSQDTWCSLPTPYDVPCQHSILHCSTWGTQQNHTMQKNLLFASSAFSTFLGWCACFGNGEYLFGTWGKSWKPRKRFWPRS